MGKGESRTIYKWVMDDVTANILKEFQAANLDE